MDSTRADNGVDRIRPHSLVVDGLLGMLNSERVRQCAEIGLVLYLVARYINL